MGDDSDRKNSVVAASESSGQDCQLHGGLATLGLSTEMQQVRSGVNLWLKMSLFRELWEDISDLYTSAADTYLPACNHICCSSCCRLFSGSVPQPLTVS